MDNKYIWTEAELSQGSEEWHEWRKNGIGASSVACLMLESPFESLVMLWEYRVGERPPKVWSAVMQQGNEKEPAARRCYEKHFSPVDPVCISHPDHSWMRASLDGITTDLSAVLEIKCPRDKAAHTKQTKDGVVPGYRRAQLQHQLAIANALWGTEEAHYWSYWDDDNYSRIVVPYDRAYANELIRRERIFLDYVERRERPPSNLFRENGPKINIIGG